MVRFCSSISIDQYMNMAKSEQINQPEKLSKNTPISTCEQSLSALIDLIILMAVIGSCGFLIYPYAKLLFSQTLEILALIMSVVKDEFFSAPMIYGCLGLSIFSASMAVLAITVFTSHKCGRRGCRGLQKAAEFDIELETEDSVKKLNVSSKLGKIGLRKGLFELPRDYHRELEAELKKMAPTNGRAVLVFRGRCGCSLGKMEVLGPKKNTRKIKK